MIKDQEQDIKIIDFFSEGYPKVLSNAVNTGAHTFHISLILVGAKLEGQKRLKKDVKVKRSSSQDKIQT